MFKSVESVAGHEASRAGVSTESVPDILDRELQALIEDWLFRVELEPELTCIPLNFEERTGHLPRLLHDVTARLRLDAGTKAPISEAAAAHGDLRRKQGYPVEMLIEESRLLQVCIFSTLHKNVKNLEFSTLLPNVVTIADEVDAQLKQQMLRFKVADAAVMAFEKRKTPREREIVQLVAEGKSSKQVAISLGRVNPPNKRHEKT
jgi:hypothetical protein